ncbi:hypothetical protein CSUB01_08695 [Colletotrichum sublineola]|uniref:Uncharacterized protein n=1 Tax=Colletotrichum sublineola TaxID=1173701 RepID=A0A066WWL5_COLSU|nr:hypothetical protein CSUB01_08695 [Colletotrichum sublineola]
MAPWAQPQILVDKPYDDEERRQREEDPTQQLKELVVLDRPHAASCERLVLGCYKDTTRMVNAKPPLVLALIRFSPQQHSPSASLTVQLACTHVSTKFEKAVSAHKHV